MNTSVPQNNQISNKRKLTNENSLQQQIKNKRTSVYNAEYYAKNLVGTEKYEVKKHNMRQYSAKLISLSEFPGTPEHRLRKEKMKQYNAEHISLSEIAGSPEHKLRKEKMRQYSAEHISLSEMPGTPEHKLRKEKVRQYSSALSIYLSLEPLVHMSIN